MDVSVKMLKDQLSRYLRLAAEGKTITVLSHNKPVARLVAAESDRSSKKVPLRDLPGVSWSGKSFKAEMPTVINKGKIQVSDILIEERG